jgi:hypothetical protein
MSTTAEAWKKHLNSCGVERSVSIIGGMPQTFYKIPGRPFRNGRTTTKDEDFRQANNVSGK